MNLNESKLGSITKVRCSRLETEPSLPRCTNESLVASDNVVSLQKKDNLEHDAKLSTQKSTQPQEC